MATRCSIIYGFELCVMRMHNHMQKFKSLPEFLLALLLSFLIVECNSDIFHNYHTVLDIDIIARNSSLVHYIPC